MVREQFRYLSDKEFEAIKDLDENSEEVRVARELDIARHEEKQARLAKSFARKAKEIRDDQENRNNSLVRKFGSYMEAVGNDPFAACDLFLYNEPEFRAIMNRDLIDKYGDKVKSHLIDYSLTAAKAGADELKRYRALMVTTDDPGVANTVDTTVAQNIVFRTGNIGNVMPLVQKVSIPYGDYELPYYNKYALGGYLTETGTVPDYNQYLSDATDGINKTKWTPRDFALGLEQSFRSLKKLSPSILSQIFDFIADAMTAGMEYQAVSGPGTGTTDTGMITNATSITAGSNAYLKLVNAKSELGSKNVSRFVGFANADAIGEFLKLRVVNMAYRDSIVPMENGVAIDGDPIYRVRDQVIATSGGSTTVVVGDPSHYLVVNTGVLEEYIDMRPESLQKFTAFHMLRDGDAIYDDSFAKFTLAV